MPYVLLLTGIALGLFGLYKFFVSAPPKQIVAFMGTAVFLILTAALFFMAVTGRLPAALALVAALWPLALAWWKTQYQPTARTGKSAPAQPLDRHEALEILGLTSDATPAEIEDAYKRLMLKLHPDQQGSDWMAAKLNEAKDTLSKQ